MVALYSEIFSVIMSFVMM